MNGHGGTNHSRSECCGALAPAAAAAFLLCGCSAGGPPVTLPSFDDVASAPPAIRAAAEAVVLVTIPGGMATGSFISRSGLLLTNNHVLGVGICPVEGCYAQLTWDYQRGTSRQQPTTIFLVPKAVDIGLDMAILQASMEAGGPPLQTPSYLTIDSRDPALLQGTHVTVVGHPEGSVKKWSSGEVVDSDGQWIWTTAFALPGNSGSPFLDDHGHLVGLLHRGPTGLDLVAGNGVNESSIGTASAALIAAMGEPLPGSMWSVAAPTVEADVVSHQLVYLAAHTRTALVNGVPQDVLASLGTACDAALTVTDYSSPEDLTSALEPCFDAENWIECRADAQKPYGVCPDDASAWQRRYKAVFEYWRSFNGNLELDEMSFAEAALAASRADGRAAGAQLLAQALGEARPPLDFHVALHLAAFDMDSYGGKSVVDFARGYASVPDYRLMGSDLVATILWLGDLGTLDTSKAKDLLDALHGDPTIDLGTRLFIELAEYDRGVLP
jgi:trypsin-like peptidase